MKYLDQSGFSLCLPPTYTWSPKGQRLPVRTRWGSKGRINLIGSWSLQGAQEQLEYRFLEGSCGKQAVIAYLDALASHALRMNTFTVVVLDNASFHRAKDVQDRRPHWEEQGLYLRYLPAYCPHLNLIEGIWRQLKGFLMPRRYYNSLEELNAALLSALATLNAVEVQG